MSRRAETVKARQEGRAIETESCSVVELNQRLSHLKCPNAEGNSHEKGAGSLLREFDPVTALSRKSIKEEQRLNALLKSRQNQTKPDGVRQLLEHKLTGNEVDVLSSFGGSSTFKRRLLRRGRKEERPVNKEWEAKALADLEAANLRHEGDGTVSAPNLARLYNGGLLAFATKLSAKLNLCRKSHGLFWFASQLAQYSVRVNLSLQHCYHVSADMAVTIQLRPRRDLLEYVEMLKEKMGLPADRKYIGCQVRHGDKSCKLCKRHSWDEYAHTLSQIATNTGLNSVFLASDDMAAFKELPALLPHLSFYSIPLKYFPLEM